MVQCVSLAWKSCPLYDRANVNKKPDAILAFAAINLALRVPRIKDARTQQLAIIIWATVVFGMYSFLMSVFRIKNGGYPFWLPPF